MRNKRYFNTKAVTPRLLKYFAGSRPSALKTRLRNPPPGQITTAAPVAISLGAGKTVIDGLLIVFTHQSLACSGSFFLFSKPGAPFFHNGITILSCADAEPAIKNETTRNKYR